MIYNTLDLPSAAITEFEIITVSTLNTDSVLILQAWMSVGLTELCRTLAEVFDFSTVSHSFTPLTEPDAQNNNINNQCFLFIYIDFHNTTPIHSTS